MALTTVDAGLLNSQSQQTWRNRIINGAMVIDQRNAGASVTITAASANQYVLDRFYLRAESATGSKVSVQRSTVAPAGFINSQLITSLSAYTLGASEHFATIQPIEGLNVADLGWGTANAQTVTLSFKVRSSLTGTFGGFLLNSAANRCYVFSYTINAANTFEDKTITIPGDTSGTWLTDNGIGIFVSFSVGAGSSTTGAAGSWGSTFYRSVTGQTSLVGTNGATFYITGVQLEKGSTATSFDYRPYGTELALCQRYYYKIVADTSVQGYANAGFCDSTTGYIGITSFPVAMRAKPTFSTTGTASDYNIRFAGGNIATCTAVPTASDVCLFTGRIDGTASGMTTGYGAALRNATTSGFFAFSAEL